MANDGFPSRPPQTAGDILRALTGAATLALGALLVGQGTSQLAALPNGGAGQLLVAGASTPAWSGSGLTYASAQLAGSGGSAPVAQASTAWALSGGIGRFGGGLFVDATTPSTSTTTGAHVVAGGLGVAEASFFGGVVTVPNGTAGAPGLRITSEPSGLYRASATSLGVSIAGTLALTIGSSSTFLQSSSTFTVFNTTPATSTISAACVVSGGFAAGGGAFFGGDVTRVGSSAAQIEYLIQNTGTGTSSRSRYRATNAAGDIAMVAGVYNASNTQASYGFPLGNWANLECGGGSVNGLVIGCTAVDKPIVFGINTSEVGRFTSGTLSTGSLAIKYTTASTSTTTGGTTFAGGVGIAGAAYIGGVLNASPTTSTSNAVVLSPNCTALNGQAIFSQPIMSFSADSGNRSRAWAFDFRTAAASTFNLTNALVADNCVASFGFVHQGTGTIADFAGLNVNLANSSTGIITTWRGVRINASALGSTVNYIGVDLQSVTTASGYTYGLQIGNISGGTDPRAINTGTGRVVFGDTTDASAIGTAGFASSGGGSFAKSLWVGGTAGNYINIANATGELRVNGTKVLGARGAAVADATGGSTVDAEARTAINALLARMRDHGAIAA